MVGRIGRAGLSSGRVVKDELDMAKAYILNYETREY